MNKKNVLVFIFFLFSFFKAFSQADDLMIVEYADWNVGAGLAFEIYNPTCDTIDLSNYKITLYEDGRTTPLGGVSHTLQGKLAPLSSVVIKNRATSPAAFVNCYKDSIIQSLGLTGNAALVLSKGSSITNFVDMVGIYGVSITGSGAEPTPTVNGVTNALFQNRIIRNSTNSTRYTSTDGISANSWPSNSSTNVTGWTVGGAGTCVVKGFTLSGATAKKPSIQGDSAIEICIGTLDSTFTVAKGSNSSKVKWILNSRNGSAISGSDSGLSVKITLGSNEGIDTLLVQENNICLGQTLTDTVIVNLKQCAKGCVIINEVMVRPATNNNVNRFSGEWLELFNTCCDTTDISCFKISDGNWALTIPKGTKIAPQSFYTIGSDSNAFAKPNLSINSCNCIASNQSLPLLGSLSDNKGQLVFFDTVGKIQDAIIWNGGNGLPATQNAPKNGICDSLLLSLPQNNGKRYSDIGNPLADTAKTRSIDGGNVWINMPVSSVTFGKSNNGGINTVSIVTKKRDTVFACGQKEIIRINQTGSGAITATLRNGNGTTGSTFAIFGVGDSIALNTGRNAGIDTLLVRKNNPACLPLYDTLYRIVQPCNCNWITTPQKDTAVCAGQALQLRSNPSVDWFMYKNNRQNQIATAIDSILILTQLSRTDTIIAIRKSCPDTSIVKINALPFSLPLRDTVACLGTPIQIQAVISPKTAFKWQPSTGLNDSTSLSPNARPSQTTNYVLLLTDSVSGCTAKDSFSLQINLLPQIAPMATKTICVGDSIQLQPQYQNTNTVFWKPSIGLSCNTCTSPFAKPSLSTVYTVIATSLQNCSDSQTFRVNTISLPTTLAQQDDTICEGQDIQLLANGGNRYLWNTGDTTNTILVRPSASTVYTVRANTAGCFGNTDSVVIVVLQNPSASFTATPLTGQALLNVNFTNNSSRATGYSWFNEGALISNSVTPDGVTFSDTGKKRLLLVATNSFGCTDTFELFINVLPQVSFFVPNVFTPNGDSLNDYFEVVSQGITSISGNIFNRWGEEVFEMNKNKPFWDGNYRDAECPSGVYFCVLRYTDIEGRIFNYSGTITLIR